MTHQPTRPSSKSVGNRSPGRCLLYEIELSEAALADLDHFSSTEVEEIFSVLLSLSGNPKPAGIEAIPLPEAADGTAYLYETVHYSIFYNIFELARIIKVVAIFKKISLN